jgi:hypothetical protein
MAVTQTLDTGLCRIRLHLDPRRNGNPWTDRPTVRVLRGEPGREPHAETVPMEWHTPDTLGLDLRLTGTETVLPTLDIPGLASTALAPMRLPYSPEFALTVYRNGRETLRQLADTTGGTERIDLSAMWSAIPHHPRWLSLTPWFLLASVLVFLLEVFQRRTGLLADMSKRLGIRRRPAAILETSGKQQAASARSVKQPISLGVQSSPNPESPSQEPAPSKPSARPEAENSSGQDRRAGLFDALDQASNRARRRNE